MAGIPQITNPITNKGLSSGTLADKHGGQAGEPFDIIQLTKPQAVASSADRQAGRQPGMAAEQKEFLPMSVKTPKDPTMAVESLKQLISADLLSVAKSNGYTDLYGELEGLMKTLFLKPDELVSEITTQEQQTTMFSGEKLFDLLRNLAFSSLHSGNTELQNAIGSFLKSVNFLQGRDDILQAISSNLKFLSGYFSPNKNLSSDLALLAEQWGKADSSKYFELLKSETLSILKNVSESILGNDRTQILIPLIIHNLSRYNTNASMLSESFSNLLTFVPGEQARGELVRAFDAFVRNFMGEPETSAEGEEAGAARNNQDNQASQANAAGKNGETLQQRQQNQTQIPEFLGDRLKDTSYLRHALTAAGSEELVPEDDAVPNPNPNVIQRRMATPEGFDDIPDDGTDGEQLKLSPNMQRALSDQITRHTQDFLLGKTDGMNAVYNILDTLIIEPAAKQTLVSELFNLDSISAVLEYMNQVLRGVPQGDICQSLFENFEQIIDLMAQNGELPTDPSEFPDENAELAEQAEQAGAKQPPDEDIDKQFDKQEQIARQGHTGAKAQRPSTLEQLVGFVGRNIDHAALKTINNYNASNLLQSLINAPGVFTPLAHYIIPLQIDGTKSFGELWVDNDEENATGAGQSARGYHLFLTFEIEAYGRFEVDLAAADKAVSVALYHPQSFSEKVGGLVNKIGRVIAQTGYQTKNFSTCTLVKPRNLTQVFPDIVERRKGFNVKA